GCSPRSSPVVGTGCFPPPVRTDASGFWSPTGFEVGTTYRATPALGTFIFEPPSRDFTATGELDFTATFVGCDTFTAVPIAIGQSVPGDLSVSDCVSPVFGSGGGHFADRYAFDGTEGQQVAVLATSGDFTPAIALIRVSDRQIVHSVSGSGTSARLPASSLFTPPPTGASFIDVAASSSAMAGGD